MSGTLRFENIVFTMNDCPECDEDTPVVCELTPRGDLVLHNYDLEADEAAAALGFDPSRCMLLEQLWEDAFDDTTPTELGSLPELLEVEAVRMLEEMGSAIARMLVGSTYSRDRQGVDFVLIGLYQTGSESVNGQVVAEEKWAWSSRGGSRFNYRLRLKLKTTVQAAIDVFRFIPTGLVLDEEAKTNVVVVAIDEVISDQTMFVRAGRQQRSRGAVETKRAIVERSSPLRNEWLIKEWL